MYEATAIDDSGAREQISLVATTLQAAKIAAWKAASGDHQVIYLFRGPKLIAIRDVYPQKFSENTGKWVSLKLPSYSPYSLHADLLTISPK